jgi:hypothetical protein
MAPAGAMYWLSLGTRSEIQPHPYADISARERHLIFDKRRMVPRNLVGQVSGKRRQLV